MNRVASSTPIGGAPPDEAHTAASQAFVMDLARALLVFGTPAHRLEENLSILVLVPGSIGFRSVSMLLESDVLSGVNTAFTMALAAIALVAGVLFASLLVPPRRLL